MKRTKCDDNDDTLVSGHSALVLRVSELQEQVIDRFSAAVAACLADKKYWSYRIAGMSMDGSSGRAQHICYVELSIACDVTVPPDADAQYEVSWKPELRETAVQVVLDVDTWRTLSCGMHTFVSQVCRAMLTKKYDTGGVFAADQPDWREVDIIESPSRVSVAITFKGSESTLDIYKTTKEYKAWLDRQDNNE